MIEPPQVPDGCRVIPLYRNGSGNNFYPIYEIVDYTIVDEIDYGWLNQHRWFMQENKVGDHYAIRTEHHGRKTIIISMAREILSLLCGTGNSSQAEHRDHNTLNNRRKNLRVATPSQNMANRKGYSSTQRFKGVRLNNSKYQAKIVFNKSDICFTSVLTDVEAALMYNYAAYLIQGEFARLNIIPDDEMPTPDRQWELYDMVVAKLREKGFPCEDALLKEAS